MATLHTFLDAGRRAQLQADMAEPPQKPAVPTWRELRGALLAIAFELATAEPGQIDPGLKTRILEHAKTYGGRNVNHV